MSKINDDDDDDDDDDSQDLANSQLTNMHITVIQFILNCSCLPV